jgi:hypothetical protein
MEEIENRRDDNYHTTKKIIFEVICYQCVCIPEKVSEKKKNENKNSFSQEVDEHVFFEWNMTCSSYHKRHKGSTESESNFRDKKDRCIEFFKKEFYFSYKFFCESKESTIFPRKSIKKISSYTIPKNITNQISKRYADKNRKKIKRSYLQ